MPHTTDIDRLPPHSIEAERSALGAILLKNDAFYQVQEVGIEGRDFYHSAHQKIFEVIQALAQRNEPIDLLTLRQYLQQSLRLPVEPELQFQPDAQTRYVVVDSVLAEIKRAGVTKLGFVGNEQYGNF